MLLLIFVTIFPYVFKGRKVQQNQYTYWTSLPPEWIMNMKLRKGDEISVEMIEDGSLLIRPVKIETPATPAKDIAGATAQPLEEGQHG